MRKLKIVLVLTLLTFTFGGGVAFAYDLPGEPGIIKRVTGSSLDTAVRVYKLVRFGANALVGSVQTISAGEAVVWDTVSDDGITIRRTTTSGDGAFAGIAVTAIPSSDHQTGVSAADDDGNENWGYIIVHGPTTAFTRGESNGASVGDVFITSTDSGAITSFEAFSVDNSSTTGPGNNARQLKAAGSVGGFFLDAPGAGMSRTDVFVKAE